MTNDTTAEEQQWRQLETSLHAHYQHDDGRVLSGSECLAYLNVLESDKATAVKALRERQDDIRFLLRFVPAWAKEVPEGLDPTMYGTGTAAGDREIKARVDAIEAQAALDALGERDEKE